MQVNQQNPKGLKLNKHIKTFLNLSLLGIGLGVILGSFFKAISSRPPAERNLYFGNRYHNKTYKKNHEVKFNLLKYDSEIIKLSRKWSEIANQNKDLETSSYIIILNENKFAAYNSDKVLPAASTIKIPILIIALEMLDRGELILNEPIRLENDLIGGGAGWIAYEPLGTIFPFHELANEMIRISDNTATNLLIRRLGGIEVINKRIKEMGLKNTQINNLLPDLKGTNTTSAKDLALSIALADSNGFLSTRSRDLFREIMSTSNSNNLIPKGVLTGLGENQGNIDYKLLIEGFRIYNKTGDIGITYADAALIEMPDNTRAVAGFIVKGPFNDIRSPDLIRSKAKAIIDILNPQSTLNLEKSTN